jgi:hypothetical protein
MTIDKGRHHGGYDTDFDAENLNLIPQAKMEQLQQLGVVSVWKVNGRFIRDWIFIDFTEGGNSEAYPWMPPNEIWIDNSEWEPEDESQFTLLHELTEFNLMRNKDMTYAAAHDEACLTEVKGRRNPARLPELLAAEAAKAGAESPRNKISKSRLTPGYS